MNANDLSSQEQVRCSKARRGRPPKMQSSAREAAILRATAQLLLEIPFDDVTMDEVSTRAGMSKRTIYEHFKSREDLLVRAVIDISRTVFLPLSSEDAQRPLRDRLSLLLRINAPQGSETGKLECLRSIVAKAQSFPVLAQELHSNGYGALQGFVRAEISRAIESRELALAPTDVGMAAEMLLDMAFEDTLSRLLRPDLPPPSEAEVSRRRELAITIFLRGCAP